MILAADKDLLAFDKPSGLRTIPDGYDRTLPTVASLLEPEWGRLWIVHRLDKDTSGVLLLARTPDAHRDLSRQFQNHQVQKVYVALCLGVPKWSEKIIDLPLRVNGDRAHRTIHDPNKGKLARTALRLLGSREYYSLIEARPSTGYTHQIRAHLALAGLPLLGDPLYAYPPAWIGPRLDPAFAPPLNRTALHARSITFYHPGSHMSTTISSPDPADFIPWIMS